MKRTRWIDRALLSAVAMLAVSTFASCELLGSLLGLSFGNSAPTVSLSANAEYAYSDQTVTFTASASDADGDSLTYTWYWNGQQVTSGTDSSVSWYWLTSSDATEVVSVVVSDGTDETNADTSLTVYAGASLRIDNNSTMYTVNGLYLSTDGSYWGYDIYDSYCYPGYRITVYNLGSSYYYFRAYDTTGAYWSTSSSYYTDLGYYRIWDLYDEYSNMNSESNVTSNVAAGSSAIPAGAESKASEATPPTGSAPAHYSLTPIPSSDLELGGTEGNTLHAVKY